MANQIKIKRFKEGGLSEIYQDVEMRFAFVTSQKEGYKQCHPLAKCRDFLHDAVSAHLHRGRVSIYGFSYEYGNNPPLDMRKMRMLVKRADKDSDATFKTQMGNAKKLLGHYEKMVGFTETKILKVAGEPGLRLFVGSGEWMKAPHLVSLYTLLIRLGEYKAAFKTDADLQKEFERIVKESKTKGRYGSEPNDIRYLRQVRQKLTTIVENTDKLVQRETIANYPKVHTDALHNYGGIVSLCTDRHFNKELKTAFTNLTSGKSK